MFIISVKDKFSAAHKIPGHHKCGNIHGHNFGVEVMFKSLVAPKDENGMTVDFAKAKEIVQDITQKEFDHHFIEELVINDKKVPVSAENLARYLYLKISEKLLEEDLPLEVYSIKICETDNFCAIYLVI